MEHDALREIHKQLSEALDEYGAEYCKGLRLARSIVLMHMPTGEAISVGRLVWEEMLQRKREQLPPAA